MGPVGMVRKSHDQRRGERGIALLLALVALVLLTFLGLTMAASSSTELQIAANYRWSQMAFYNALAGIEAGRAALGAPGVDWNQLVPTRTVSWDPQAIGGPGVSIAPPTEVASLGGTRDFEMGACDQTGNGMGYGVVLATTMVYQDVAAIAGQPLPGGFTLWVRRPIQPDVTGAAPGLTHDRPIPDPSSGQPIPVLILTSEGIAPDLAGGDVRAQRARRLVEVTLYRAEQPQEPGCDPVTASGAGFENCDPTGGAGTVMEAFAGAIAGGGGGGGATGGRLEN